MGAGDDIGLERLLDYDRRRYWLVNDWSVRLRVHRVRAHPGRPAGIKYSFTLHDDRGRRLLGFDNAHAVGTSTAFDHQHRYRDFGSTRPYRYRGAEQLLTDFFAAVERACRIEGVPFEFDAEDLLGDVPMEDDDDA